MSIRNLNYIRGLSLPDFPDLGARLFEALSDLHQQSATLSQQVNGNSGGQPAPPPAVGGVTVQAQNGHFQVAIQDDSPIYRGVQYYVEHADNPHFTNSHVENLGDSRNTNLFLGNVTRYFRAYSSYVSSPAGPAVYHGSETAPTPVEGGGLVGGPAFLPAQSTGTGLPGQGISGPGPVPFRAADGIPPVR